MAKAEMCGLHCPKWMMWLFGAVSLWFVLSAFGISTFGGFWSWIVLLSGVCSGVCATSTAHKKTACPFANIPVWIGVVLTIVGAWYVLADERILSTYGINLLYLVVFIASVGVYQMRK